jgi:hypothetical protein
VRGSSYTPVMIAPNGVRTSKPAIPFRPVAVTPADRRAHIQELEQQLSDARRRSPSGSATRVRVAEPLQWATMKPALRSSTIRVDPRQRAWVAVYDALDSLGTRYDLLDRDAKRVASVRMARGELLVGFGQAVLYTARRDADDLVYLRRYPLP